MGGQYKSQIYGLCIPKTNKHNHYLLTHGLHSMEIVVE